MKSTRSRSIFICILSFAFIAGLGFYIFELIMNASNWALYPTNPHITSNTLTEMGSIVDKNNVVLAESKDDKRVYNSDPEVRKAMLHTVGDDSGSITTAIQSTHGSDLWGYNIVTGLNPPDFMSNSKDIKLTLDSNVCKIAMHSLGNRKGAVAVYNYKTGEMICMSSVPTYDPTTTPNLENPFYNDVYFNRVMSYPYPPGSTFKVITCACAIDNLPSINSENFYCNHKKAVNGGTIICDSTHGNINFKNAMCQSCNIAFGDIAIKLGKDKMIKTTDEMGFNKSFDIDGIKTAKSSYSHNMKTDADLGWSGIGQFEDEIVPIHALIMMGAIANDGVPVMPRLIDTIKTSTGTNKSTKTMGDRLLKQTTAEQLKELLRYDVVNNYKESSFGNIKEVCAKTGTAEVKKGKDPHGWVVGFSKDQSTPYAFVVIVENGGYGSRCATPIAATVLNEIIKK